MYKNTVNSLLRSGIVQTNIESAIKKFKIPKKSQEDFMNLAEFWKWAAWKEGKDEGKKEIKDNITNLLGLKQ